MAKLRTPEARKMRTRPWAPKAYRAPVARPIMANWMKRLTVSARSPHGHSREVLALDLVYPAEQLRRRPRQADRPAVHHVATVGHVECNAHVLLDEEHRASVVGRGSQVRQQAR